MTRGKFIETNAVSAGLAQVDDPLVCSISRELRAGPKIQNRTVIKRDIASYFSHLAGPLIGFMPKAISKVTRSGLVSMMPLNADLQRVPTRKA